MRGTQTIIMPWHLSKQKNELANIYLKEQTEFIPNQINNISDSVKDRQSTIAWQTVNGVSRRKSTAKDKLKATSKQEWIHLWKQHFENLLSKPQKIFHEPITKFISNQLNIKLGQFTLEELNSVLRKNKLGKQQGLMKYSQKYGRPGNLTAY